MTAIPAVLDALVAAFRAAPGVSADSVFDGPETAAVRIEGIAVGMSVEDRAVEFTWSYADPGGGDREHGVVSCVAWSGSGDTSFQPHRDRVAELLSAAAAGLAVDRTLGGAVSTAWITGGAFTQEQTGSGALVTAEFRVEFDRF